MEPIDKLNIIILNFLLKAEIKSEFACSDFFVGWQIFDAETHIMLISIKVNDPTRNCMDLDTSLTSFNVPFPLVMRTLESMSQVYQDLFLTMIPPQDSFFKDFSSNGPVVGPELPVCQKF